MKTSLSISVLMAATALMPAHADSVHQWGAWNVAVAAPNAPTVPQFRPFEKQTDASPSGATHGGSSASGSGAAPWTLAAGSSYAPVDVLLKVANNGGSPIADGLAADLQALKVGNVVASYTGRSSGAHFVSMSVDFGKSTWTGSWGASVIGTGLPFSAGGQISGATLTGGVVNTPGASGSIVGALSGSGAGFINGTSNVTAMAASGPVTQAATFSVAK